MSYKVHYHLVPANLPKQSHSTTFPWAPSIGVIDNYRNFVNILNSLSSFSYTVLAPFKDLSSHLKLMFYLANFFLALKKAVTYTG